MKIVRMRKAHGCIVGLALVNRQVRTHIVAIALKRKRLGEYDVGPQKLDEFSL